MQLNKSIVIILICALLIGNFVLLWKNRQLIEYYSEQVLECDNISADILSREQIMYEFAQNIEIPDQYAEYNGLYFLFSDKMCHSCIEQELELLFMYCKSKVSQVHFFCFSNDSQTLKRFKTLFKMQNVVMIPIAENWGINISNYDVPILFIKRSSGCSINQVFIPNKQYAGFSEQYYQSINTFLNEN